ncbi:hypothetical protein PanWU01x14_165520 [Parasponia andersonii]|uniref:Uncharacterized protein n=1 Tax=Parasponia andersonii TaxID=3476 RepID=A0A2P5CBW8_PARAD|nr:hypothetical protein PanWU01x14_165520 [Parasponia andersonii]
MISIKPSLHLLSTFEIDRTPSAAASCSSLTWQSSQIVPHGKSLSTLTFMGKQILMVAFVADSFMKAFCTSLTSDGCLGMICEADRSPFCIGVPAIVLEIRSFPFLGRLAGPIWLPMPLPTGVDIEEFSCQEEKSHQRSTII